MSGTGFPSGAGLGDLAAWATPVQPGVPDTRQVPERRTDGMPASAEERYLRRLLASRSGIPQLYRDDGEASGYAEGVAIDFMRDTAEELDTKLRAIALARYKKIAPAEPERYSRAWFLLRAEE
jgi:hypothetical protein